MRIIFLRRPNISAAVVLRAEERGKPYTCLPVGYKAHDGSSNGFSKKGIYDGVESGCVTKVDAAEAPFEVYRPKAEGKLCNSQRRLTVPRLNMVVLEA